MIEIVKKILLGNPITESELNEFIVEYSKLFQLNVSGEQLMAANTLIKHGVFDLTFAAKTAGILIGLNFYSIFDQHGGFVKFVVVDNNEQK